MNPRAKKSLGQNFLMHRQTAERIAQAARIDGQTVLEIGPGTGMLTRALLSRAKKVIAIEADAELIPTLQQEFSSDIASGKLTLIHADVRTFEPSSLGEPYALVANIPYYLTGELFRKFLGADAKPSSLTFLVQKEVAVRIARSKKESLLSLSVKAFGTPHIEFPVPKGAFKPAPSVDSAVMSVRDIRQDAFQSKEEEDRFFEVIRAGFAHKRKLLSGNLTALAAPERVKEALHDAGIREKARAEDVALPAWKALARSLSRGNT